MSICIFVVSGIYLTDSIQYALKYAKEDDKANDEGKVMIISLVAPGNPLPVISDPSKNELKGKAIPFGYQSHIILGENQINSIPKSISHFLNPANRQGMPVMKKNEKRVRGMEVVVDQQAQVLPRYVIYLSRKSEKKQEEEKEFNDEE